MFPSKILVIKLRALGDTVLMTAPVRELTRAYPNADIHVLVLESWAPLFTAFPGVEKVWTYVRKKEKIARTRALARLAYQLRQEKYDWVVNLHASPSSSILAFATGAKVRSIHFHGHHHKNRYSTVTIPGKGVLKPIIERDMDTLRALGLSIPAGRNPQIDLTLSETEIAKHYLRSTLGLTQPVLGISLGASKPTKSWPVERYASLAIDWARKTNGGVLAFAGPNETQLIQDFLKWIDEYLHQSFNEIEKRSQIRKQIVAQNHFSVRQLAGLLSQLSVLAGNDSGPKHLGVAVGTPTVTLFGPEDPFEWHPYPTHEHHFHFIESLTCRRDADPGMPPWCGLNICQVEEHKCMKLIGVDSVTESCLRVARRS